MKLKVYTTDLQCLESADDIWDDETEQGTREFVEELLANPLKEGGSMSFEGPSGIWHCIPARHVYRVEIVE